MELMETRGFQLNTVVFGAAIAACSRSGQWERSLSLLDEMASRGVPASLPCFNSAISACEKARRADEAIALFEQVRYTRYVAAVTLRCTCAISSSRSASGESLREREGA